LPLSHTTKGAILPFNNSVHNLILPEPAFPGSIRRRLVK